MPNLLNVIAPPLTIRRQFITLLSQAPVIVKQYGFGGLVSEYLAAIRRYYNTGTLYRPEQIKSEQPTVLLVSHDMSMSGAPMMLYFLAAFLVKSGFRVIVSSPKEGALQKLFEAAKITVDINQPLDAHFHDPIAIAQLARLCDLVIANTIISWQSILVAKSMSKPTLWWLHESHLGVDYCNQLPIVDHCLTLVDRVVFPATATANLYHAQRTINATSIVPYGLPVSELTVDSARNSIEHRNDAKIRIVCIGSLEHRKGQDILLFAFRNLPKEMQSRIQLLFIGRPFIQEFADAIYAEASGFPSIEFLGEVDHSGVMTHLQTADILVHPSRDEVLPVILLESMFHQCAIIATRVGGVEEAITDGVHGLLVEPENPVELAKAIERLAQDSALRQTMGRNAHQRFCENFTMERMGQQFVDIINELLVSKV